METEPFILLPDGPRWKQPRGCRRVLCAHTLSGVLPVLREAEQAAAAGSLAAGFVSYEAAPAFDPALAARPAGPLPLAWFAVFDADNLQDVADLPQADAGGGAWQPDMTEADHADAIRAIHAAIARGETYQVNLTFPFTTAFSGPALPCFARLAAAQRGAHGVFIETEDFAICSASPELFFERDGDRIRCRPMKGTAPRGRWTAEDDAAAEALRHSAKNRAENLMIVDMVRNDLGRIAETGSVVTTSLFDIERYPTILQMTSTIEATTNAGVPDIFRALFPSASITGAPKVQTSRIIAALEARPRGVYCGAVGWIGPGRSASFNVAIRTIVIDRRAGRAVFGTGSGVVWDSDARSEYAECLAKASILTAPPRPDFQLLETLRCDASNGWKFLDEHIARLAASARYFGIEFDDKAVRAALEQVPANAKRTGRSSRIRLLVDAAGRITVETLPVLLPGFFDDRPAVTTPFLRAAVAGAPVDSRDVFLFHKTTHRAAYERARASRPGVEEVLLVNERGELTEGTIGNVVLQIGDEFLTPPLDCGLLPGVFRQHLLARGALREAVLTPHDLHRANAAWLVNSVRGWSRLALQE